MLQCFDTIGWVTEKAFGLQKPRLPKNCFINLQRLSSGGHLDPAWPAVINGKNRSDKQKPEVVGVVVLPVLW